MIARAPLCAGQTGLLALLALLLAACGHPDVPVDAPRGVLLISLDTVRADHLQPWGGPADTMPVVSALASRGVVFERAFAPMSQTLPSHATLLTGQSPRTHGALENYYRLGEEATTLAEALADRGWATAGFVGALVLDEARGIAQGFEHWTQPSGEWTAGVVHQAERSAAAVTDDVLAWAAGHDP